MADAPANKSPSNAFGWLAVAMVGVLVAQLWLGQRTSVTLDHSDFKAMLGRGQITTPAQAEARGRETIVAHAAALNEWAQLLLTQETVERQSITKILRDSKRSRTVPSTTDAVAPA